MKKIYLWIFLAGFYPFSGFAETSSEAPTGPALFAPLPMATAVEMAKQRLAERNHLAAENLREVSANAVQWPDSSLGCPRPDMMYAQVLTPGYRVTLMDSSSGKEYVVHVGPGRALVCDKREPGQQKDEALP